MPDPLSVPSSAAPKTGAVRLWLYCVAAMIFLTLVVGGATRLTESGLSITEWKPVTGVLPPLSDADWQAEFDKYRQIPQYQQVNKGMSLAAFKTIFYWEWSHRLLARTTGFVFLVPFLFFLWRGMIPRGLKTRLWLIFAGGAALGAVGWWMVSSGLAGSNLTSVSQYRLAFHLTLACAIYFAVLWTARGLLPQGEAAPPRLRIAALVLALLVLVQIYLGALVAGLDAGLIYNTWPLIDGSVIPEAARLWHIDPAWRNLFENTLTVQFVHRMMAYTIWLIAAWHVYDAWKNQRAAGGAVVVFVFVTAQAVLGIATLLHMVPLSLAIAHQALAVIVLTVAVVHAQRLSPRAPVAALKPVGQAA
ncbi:COX15/CtaA family protein [Undibacter mobilis]|uniref:Heme A synthase n=1 Tax=Undibacter mobilis TaxID=2292256 RepID=A0A371B198_9BRAD|nr:COX15/CtaA family protein [Undibacter mobilis]RDV01320.1 heme A synthase [Undibacter mobilis]